MLVSRKRIARIDAICEKYKGYHHDSLSNKEDRFERIEKRLGRLFMKGVRGAVAHEYTLHHCTYIDDFIANYDTFYLKIDTTFKEDKEAFLWEVLKVVSDLGHTSLDENRYGFKNEIIELLTPFKEKSNEWIKNKIMDVGRNLSDYSRALIAMLNKYPDELTDYLQSLTPNDKISICDTLLGECDIYDEVTVKVLARELDSALSDETQQKPYAQFLGRSWGLLNKFDLPIIEQFALKACLSTITRTTDFHVSFLSANQHVSKTMGLNFVLYDIGLEREKAIFLAKMSDLASETEGSLIDTIVKISYEQLKDAANSEDPDEKERVRVKLTELSIVTNHDWYAYAGDYLEGLCAKGKAMLSDESKATEPHQESVNSRKREADTDEWPKNEKVKLPK